MRYAALFLALALSGCGLFVKPAPAPVIYRAVPMFPPSVLYSEDGACNHGPARRTGTVNDLSGALIVERAAVDTCMGDRASLRQWVKDNSK